MSERTVTEIPATKTKNKAQEKGSILRVAAYCRVSTDSEEQLSSYQSQIEYYSTLIEENPKWKLAGIFADEGLSGTSTKKREEFNKMIQKCRRGRIDMVITKSVSRFARNSLDCLHYVRKLNEWGVDVFFEKESIHTLEQPDETLLTIMGIMAQNESMSLSKNVRLGYQHGFKSGKVIFRRIMGYLPNGDGVPEIIPEEATVVRRIYDEYLSGQSVGKIRKGLEKDGILTIQGKHKWSESTVQSIIRNEKYVGDALLQKTFIDNPLTKKSIKNVGQFPQYYVSNNHPAIIDRDLWNKVQEEISRRASKRKRPSKDAHSSSSKFSSKYALNEVLVCGECGAHYRRTVWTRKGEKVAVWRCISRLDHGNRVCKKSVTIKEERLHEILLFAINQSVYKELLFEAMADSVVELDMPELVPEISSMILSDPPELLEYDDRYARLLFYRIEVKGEVLNITFKDGTCVVQSL